MLVQRGEFEQIIDELSKPGVRSLDTETTGLRPYHGDALFSIIIADSKDCYYFNFQNYPDTEEQFILPHSYLSEFKKPFSNLKSLWYLANAKFDMSMLAREKLFIEGTIHCIQALGRVEKNDEMSYSLDTLAKRIGLAKSDDVKHYITKHKLWDWQFIPEKGKREKKLYFNRVPLNVITPYGEQDARVTLAIGDHQYRTFIEMENSRPPGVPPITEVVENEKRLTKTFFKMEQIGILIDRDYCLEALNYEKGRAENAALRFTDFIGLEFKDAPSTLTKAFSRLGYDIPKTEKGNPSFNEEELSKMKDNPLVSALKEYRDAHKKVTTYYENFLYHADHNGVIHANIRQGGTNTGRVSYSDPNLQNLPDEEEEINVSYKIRKCFIPRPGKFFLMPDYKTMEYVMLLDYAGEMELIREVLAGKDLHQATGDLFGIARKPAKTLNFGLLYGMGIAALADALGVSIEEARYMKSQYFRALPKIAELIRYASEKAQRYGYVYNWMGRKYLFSDPRFAYTAINKIIQGGCSDVLKLSLNRIDDLLADKKSKILVSVHDEILLEMDPSEKDLIPRIIEIMSTSYPHRHIPLTVDVEHSFKSWGDKVKGMPIL